MADSISQQVKKLLNDNPSISNREIYQKFPNVKQSTLRYYKAKYLEKKDLRKPAPKSPTAEKKRVSSGETAAKQTRKESLKKKVFAYLDSNPDKSNEDFYAAFPGVSKYSLRGLKISHRKSTGVGREAKPKSETRKTTARKKSSTSKIASKKQLKAMDQVKQIIRNRSGVKSSITAKAKDFGGNLRAFIKEKRKHWEGVQQVVKNEISSFLKSIKGKKG